MSDLYLIHSAKGSQRANHKYISREWNGKRWIYEYKQKASGNHGYDRYDYGKTKVSAIRDALDRSIEDRKSARRSIDGIYIYPEKARRNAAQDVMKNAKRLRDAKEESLKSKAGKALTKAVAKVNEKKIKRHTQDLLNAAKKADAKRTLENLSKNNRPTMSPQEKAKQITRDRWPIEADMRNKDSITEKLVPKNTKDRGTKVLEEAKKYNELYNETKKSVYKDVENMLYDDYSRKHMDRTVINPKTGKVMEYIKEANAKEKNANERKQRSENYHKTLADSKSKENEAKAKSPLKDSTVATKSSDTIKKENYNKKLNNTRGSLMSAVKSGNVRSKAEMENYIEKTFEGISKRDADKLIEDALKYKK